MPAVLKVRPFLSAPDVADMLVAYLVGFANLPASVVSLALSNVKDIIRSKLCACKVVSVVMPIFANLVSHIVRVSPAEKMLRINTSRVIALVTYDMAFRNITNLLRKHIPMNHLSLSINAYSGVAASYSGMACYIPTSVFFINGVFNSIVHNSNITAYSSLSSKKGGLI